MKATARRSSRGSIHAIVSMILAGLCTALLLRGYVDAGWVDQRSPMGLTRRCVGATTRFMVRNIDLPEAIILYGRSACLTENTQPPTLREGLAQFLAYCHADQAVITIIDDGALLEQLPPSNTFHVDPIWNQVGLSSYCQIRTATKSIPPPNPIDICGILDSAMIQPLAFGGSAGFGASQNREPPRAPLPSRTVVFTTTADQVRAARAAGTRVMALLLDGAFDDEGLADAAMERFLDICVDDIATPGSFWLNPSHPRDDYGNKVDPYDLIQEALAGTGSVTTRTFVVGNDNGERSSDNNASGDDELERILRDLAPL
jgi:hypothetical protein